MPRVDPFVKKSAAQLLMAVLSEIGRTEHLHSTSACVGARFGPERRSLTKIQAVIRLEEICSMCETRLPALVSLRWFASELSTNYDYTT